MLPVGVRCALGTGGGMGPEGAGPGAASFPHPTLPSMEPCGLQHFWLSSEAELEVPRAGQQLPCEHKGPPALGAAAQSLLGLLLRTAPARRAFPNLEPCDITTLHTYSSFGLSCFQCSA